MHRPSARAGRAAVIGAALALLLGACGSDSGSDGDEPSKAALACRADWSDLGKQVQGRDSRTNPSALAPRWNSVVATIDYYATSAEASGCDQAIDQQEKAISALDAFGTTLAPYDMELRLVEIRDDAEAYATGPTPSASPSATPKADKKKQKQQKKAPPPPPSPTEVANALKVLTAQAPVATQQQGPAWQQARVAELSDTSATAKSVKDLAFLSTESAAYRACQAALAQIRLALAAAEK